jgi:hypothetical protein
MNSFLRYLMSNSCRSLACATMLTVASLGLSAVPAAASDGCQNYRYEWVLCYENRQVAYTACETRYDHCGRPYQVEVTRYRTERVPVWRRVAVPNN